MSGKVYSQRFGCDVALQKHLKSAISAKTGESKIAAAAAAAAVAVSTLAACASPIVVQSRQAKDSDMNCQQIKDAYFEAQDFETKARKGRGVTGMNVAAAIFF